MSALVAAPAFALGTNAPCDIDVVGCALRRLVNCCSVHVVFVFVHSCLYFVYCSFVVFVCCCLCLVLFLVLAMLCVVCYVHFDMLLFCSHFVWGVVCIPC